LIERVSAYSAGINQRRLEGKDLRQSTGSADWNSRLLGHVPRVGSCHPTRRRKALRRLPNDEVQYTPADGQENQQGQSESLTCDLKVTDCQSPTA